MLFHTTLPYKGPNADHYADNKALRLINHNATQELPQAPHLPGTDALRRLVGDDRFTYFVSPRLNLAMQHETHATVGAHLAHFPGTHVVAPGDDGAQVNLGSLVIDRFQTAMHIRGGVCASTDEPTHTTQQTDKAKYWPWSYPEPELETIVPNTDRGDTSWNAQMFLNILQSQRYDDPVESVQRAWSPQTEWRYTNGVASAGREVVKANGAHPALVFELEEVLARARWAKGVECLGMGVYGGFWLEVFLMHLTRIRNTELVQTDRVLQELQTLLTDGFAPLVVNEFNASVDGSHRQVACWLWNLLHEISDEDLSHQHAQQLINVRVCAFARRHAQDMGDVTLREVLRIFAECMQDANKRQVLLEQVRAHTKHFPVIRVMPVIFLREQTWPTVLYGPYMSGEQAVRVDPVVYKLMDQQPNLVLPARGEGPYHFTDRALLPWFDVLSINAQR